MSYLAIPERHTRQQSRLAMFSVWTLLPPPQDEPANLWMMLFRVLSFPAVFSKCYLKVNCLSSVTTKVLWSWIIFDSLTTELNLGFVFCLSAVQVEYCYYSFFCVWYWAAIYRNNLILVLDILLVFLRWLQTCCVEWQELYYISSAGLGSYST